MLSGRGQQLLGASAGVCAAGLILGMAGVVAAGAVFLGALLIEVRRLRGGLQPLEAPWGVSGRLAPRDREASTASLHVRSHRVGQNVALQLELGVDERFAGATFEVLGWECTPGLEVTADRAAFVLAGQVTVGVVAVARSAAVHRVLGVRAVLTDAAGFVEADVFVPCPCEVAALPRSQHLDLNRLAETRRHASRSIAGLRPDNAAGHGDELRELREHQFGDPFKHIAWKASARRGRLMSRSFERERSRAVYVVLDTGSSMRMGRLGDGPMDQALDLVHSLAELSARQNLPFGATLVDGRITARVQVREGLAALQQTDRALLDVRRTVAEDLAPMPDDELLSVVAAYLRAVERVDLGLGSGVAEDYVRFRQRTVMAALARLPERERLPAMRGPEPSQRADLSILRRFCRAMDVALPYRDSVPPAARAAGLAQGISAAMAARSGPFVVIVVSDFRGLRGHNAPLFAALARARKKGHRALVVAMRDVEPTEALDYVMDAEDVDTARGLAQADRAARSQLLAELDDGCRRAGASLLADPDPRKIVAHWAAARF